MNHNYQLMESPPNERIERCPCCGSSARVWQFVHKLGSNVERVVMCDQQGDVGLRDSYVYGGCLLQKMLPLDFYKATGREAVRYWNEYARGLTALRQRTDREARHEP